MIGRGGGRNLSADRKRTTTHLRAIAAVLWLTLPIFDMSPPRPPPPPPVGLRFLSKVFQESAVAPHHAFFFLLLLFVFVSRCFRLLVRFFEASLGFFLLGSYFLKSFIRKIPLRLFSKLSGYFEIPEFRTRISMRFL